MYQSRPQVEVSSLNESRAETRRWAQMNVLRRALRVTRLVMAMTDKTATWTTQLAAAALTQHESMKRCWVEVCSQYMRRSRRTQNNDLLVLSEPPTKRADRPNGLVRHQRQRGRLNIERIKVGQAQERETTYLGHARDIVERPPPSLHSSNT